MPDKFNKKTNFATFDLKKQSILPHDLKVIHKAVFYLVDSLGSWIWFSKQKQTWAQKVKQTTDDCVQLKYAGL